MARLERILFRMAGVGALATFCHGAGLPALAEDAGAQPGLSFYGVPGYVDMPSAFVLPDGTFAFSGNATVGDVRRGTMVFQITPRLTGVFRYSYLKDFLSNGDSLYDRSFDLRYQAISEDIGGWRPAVAIGLQDFGGTGIFGAEYVVASKHFGRAVTASAGIGWGRFGSYNGFTNPLSIFSDKFKDRPGFSGIEDTGQIGFDRFFRGDAAVFLGVDWQATDRLRLSLEYSSDAMTEEVARMGFEHRTPINVELEYTFRNGGRLGFAVLNGSTAALSYSITLDPGHPAAPSGREPAPPPVMTGSAEAAASWGLVPVQGRRAGLEAALKDQGIALDGLHLDGNTATVAVTNLRWSASAQFWGRTARVLSAELPAGVTTFRIRSHIRGMPVKEVVLTRRDLEELEYAPDGAWQAYVRADIQDAAGLPDPRLAPESALDFKLRPYLDPALFDPDNPLRLDVGAELRGEWSPLRGFYVSGAIKQKVFGNLDQSTRLSDSILPHVRSDAPLYAKHSGPSIPYLTAEYFMRPAPDVYGRLSFGLLEPMFGGVSGEVLWAPQGKRYALGLELNYAVQRDFDGYGFQDYNIATGHLSGYLDFGGGFKGQVDVGRFLAGDWGTTVTMTRRFGNGFEVGAFFTITNVSFEDFGEGSFDKGITISLPLTWVTGQPTKDRGGYTIRPIQRDGGARLSVRNRLYGLVRDEADAANGDRWARFWR